MNGERIRTCFEGVTTDLYCADLGGERYVARGVDNPSTNDLNHVVERRKGKEIVFLHVLESHLGEPIIDHVQFKRDENGMWACVTKKNGERQALNLGI